MKRNYLICGQQNVRSPSENITRQNMNKGTIQQGRKFHIEWNILNCGQHNTRFPSENRHFDLWSTQC